MKAFKNIFQLGLDFYSARYKKNNNSKKEESNVNRETVHSKAKILGHI